MHTETYTLLYVPMVTSLYKCRGTLKEKCQREDNSNVVHAYKASMCEHWICLPSYVNVKMYLRSLSMNPLYIGIGEAGCGKERRKKWPPMMREADRRQSSIFKKCALDHLQDK